MHEQAVDLKVAGVLLKGKILNPQPNKTTADQTWLVLLHEALGSIRLWRDIPQLLAEATGCPTLVFERQGHGGSDPFTDARRADYLHREAFEVLPAVLRQIGIQKALLLGHSDGGSIALLFASKYPQGVVGVIAEAAHVFVEEETLAGIRQAGEIYATTGLRLKLARYHDEKTDALFAAWQDIWLSNDFRDWNIETCLPAIKAPVLVIQGEDDLYGTPAQVQAIASGVSGPCESHLIADCGHEPHREAKQQVVVLMTAFIRKCLSSSVR